MLQVMEKLVDTVHFLHLEIHEAFGSAGENSKQYSESKGILEVTNNNLNASKSFFGILTSCIR